MLNEFSRTEILIGKMAIEKLKKSTVAIFGIGGVGSYAVEALTRVGVGNFVLIDNDVVCLTNINRQLIATKKTIGKPKVLVMKERINEINEKATVITHQCFYTKENANDFDYENFSYIVDAIDTVSSKLTLIEKAKEWGVPIISCMGAGNKLDPTRFEVSDINKTTVCPLAKVMRRELKKMGIDKLKVVYSKELPIKPLENEETDSPSEFKRQIPGSVSFVPSVVGLIIAGEVVKDLINDN